MLSFPVQLGMTMLTSGHLIGFGAGAAAHIFWKHVVEDADD